MIWSHLKMKVFGCVSERSLSVITVPCWLYPSVSPQLCHWILCVWCVSVWVMKHPNVVSDTHFLTVSPLWLSVVHIKSDRTVCLKIFRVSVMESRHCVWNSFRLWSVLKKQSPRTKTYGMCVIMTSHVTLWGSLHQWHHRSMNTKLQPLTDVERGQRSSSRRQRGLESDQGGCSHRVTERLQFTCGHMTKGASSSSLWLFASVPFQ